MYSVSFFPPNPFHFSSYLLWFQDNTEVLAQNPQTAEINTEIISISIFLAFLSATLYSLWNVVQLFVVNLYIAKLYNYTYDYLSSITLLSGIIGIIFCIGTGNPISSVHTVTFALLTFTTAYVFFLKFHLHTFIRVILFFFRHCCTICSRSDSHQRSQVLPVRRPSQDSVVTLVGDEIDSDGSKKGK